MLYVAHCSFFLEGGTGPGQPGPRHGSCTCVAEAVSVVAALDIFRGLLHRLDETEDLFRGVRELYLDACVEIRAIPAGGCLTEYVERTGAVESGLATWLPGVDERQAVAYYLGPEREPQEEETDTDEPFVVFQP